MVEAENDLTSSHYINALAVFPKYRRMGLAHKLMEETDQISDQGLSLTVADSNHSARALYKKLGFAEVGHHKMEKEDWDGEGAEWISMRRSI